MKGLKIPKGWQRSNQKQYIEGGQTKQ